MRFFYLERGFRIGGVVVGIIRGVEKPILVHDPIGFDTFWRPPTIKNQGFLNANLVSSIGCHNGLVSSSRFPIPRYRRPIWSRPVWIFPLSRCEKIPFLLPKHRLACPTNSNKFNWFFEMKLRNIDSYLFTWEVPGIELVQVEIRYNGGGKWWRRELSCEIVNDEFLVGGVESESGRQLQMRRRVRRRIRALYVVGIHGGHKNLF